MKKLTMMAIVLVLPILSGCGYRYGCESPRCVPLPKNQELDEDCDVCPRLCGEQGVDYCNPGNYMY